MTRTFIAVIFSVTFFIFFFTMGIDVGHEGKFDTEREMGNYNSGELVNVKDIRDGVVSLTIDGRSALMKAGETYELEDKKGIGFAGKSEYEGTVTVKEIKEDSVILHVDVMKTKYFYIFTGALTALFSILIGAFILISPSRKRSERDGYKISEEG